MSPESSAISVVVTGGSGFIGTHLVEALRSGGAMVTNLDIRAPQLAGQREQWRQCDLLDLDSLTTAMLTAGPAVVFNLAANTDISQSSGALAVNTRGLANVVGAVRRLRRACLVVHISSQLVMRPGHQPEHPLDFAPYSDYGRSKAESELLLHHRGSEVEWTVVRPTNVWGPWHPTFGRQIWRYLDRGLYLHPRGCDPRRSYGYVDNVVHQLLRLAEVDRSEAVGQTFYVGDAPIRSSIWLDCFSHALRGRPVRRVPGALLRVAATAGDLSGRLGGPSPINRGRLYRMVSDYVVPMEQTFAILGRGPVSLEAGVSTTVAWLRSDAGRGSA